MSLEPTQPDAAAPLVTTSPLSPPSEGTLLPPPPPPPPTAQGYPPVLPYLTRAPYPPYPPYPPNPGYMPYSIPYYPGPMAPSTSYWAIASFVCALGGFALIFNFAIGLPLILIPVVVSVGALLAVIFGHIALVDISRSRGRLVGRGVALAGLIIGYVILAIALFLGVVALAAAALRP